MQKIKGFSLFEIIIATIILCLVVLGLTSVFVSGKKLTLRTVGRMAGGELGKLFIDPLQIYVRQIDWDGRALMVSRTYCGTPVAGYSPNPFVDVCPPQSGRTVNNIVYSSYSDIEDVPGTGLRRVVTNINWNEPSP